MPNGRYIIKEAWSSVYGMHGYRIWDVDRRVFVSPWYALHHRALVVLDKMMSR